MAFYHVNSCSCPVGCCDCGSTPGENEVALWYNAEEDTLFHSSWTPEKRNPEWLHENIISGKWVLLEINRYDLLSADQRLGVIDHMATVDSEIFLNYKEEMINTRTQRSKKVSRIEKEIVENFRRTNNFLYRKVYKNLSKLDAKALNNMVEMSHKNLMDILSLSRIP